MVAKLDFSFVWEKRLLNLSLNDIEVFGRIFDPTS